MENSIRSSGYYGRTNTGTSPAGLVGMGVKLHPHQERAVEELGNGKILWGGVGVGKSLTAAAYYMRKEAPKDVYVITTAKKRNELDWDGEFAKFGVGTRSDATVAGTLTVDSWNNLGRYRNVEGAFFIFDEQRLVGSGSWSKIFIRIAGRNAWILLSATPGDTWLDYVPVFVANGFYKNRTEFKREHVIYNAFTKFPKVDRYVGVGRLLRHRNSILVHMPYQRTTRRIHKDVPIEYDKALFEKVVKERWHVYENRPLRGAAELFSVMRKVVNSNPSRNSAVIELLSRHPRLIVFYNFDYELYMLRAAFTAVTEEIPMNAIELAVGNQHSSESMNQDGGEKQKNPLISEPPLTRSSPGVSKPAVQLAGNRGRKRISDKIFPIMVEPATRVSMEKEHQWQTPSPACTTLSDVVCEKQDTNLLCSVSAAQPFSTDQSILRIGSTSTTSNTTSGSTFQIAEWNGHRHDPIPETDSWIYLVQYVAGAEGWNCTETNAMVFFSLPYSYKIFEQAHGRIDRMNTPFTELYYYTLISNAVIDQIVRKALDGKKNFHESAYVGQM